MARTSFAATEAAKRDAKRPAKNGGKVATKSVAAPPTPMRASASRRAAMEKRHKLRYVGACGLPNDALRRALQLGGIKMMDSDVFDVSRRLVETVLNHALRTATMVAVAQGTATISKRTMEDALSALLRDYGSHTIVPKAAKKAKQAAGVPNA